MQFFGLSECNRVKRTSIDKGDKNETRRAHLPEVYFDIHVLL